MVAVTPALHTKKKGRKPKKGRGNWSPEDDEALRMAVRKLQASGEKVKWKQLATTVFQDRRTPVQCRMRWKTVLDDSLVKGMWSEEEDASLVRLVKELGQKWSAIAKELPGRNPLCL